MYYKGDFQCHLCNNIKSKSKGDGLGTYTNTRGPFWPPGARFEPLNPSRQKLTVLKIVAETEMVRHD
jgi:hypothetical protein